MSKVVGIGACVMDTLITVPHYPTEDTKLRAASTKLVGGGPTATGIVAVALTPNISAFYLMIPPAISLSVTSENTELVSII